MQQLILSTLLSLLALIFSFVGLTSAQTIPVRGGVQSLQPQQPTISVQPGAPQYPYWPPPSPHMYGGPLFPYYGSAAPYYPTYNYSGWMPPVMPAPTSPPVTPMPGQMMDPSATMGMQPMPGMPGPMQPMPGPMQPGISQGQMPPEAPGMFPGYLWSRAEGKAVPATPMADPDRKELERWRALSRSPLYVTIYQKEALIEWGGFSYKVPIGPDNRFQIQVPPPNAR